jgi:7-cyano-7-deazaguanine synthase in queuosine biosynthesis
MRSSGFRTDTLTVDVRATDDGVDLIYAVDSRAPAIIRLPVRVLPEQALHLLVAATAIYLASLCLAKQVRLNHRFPVGLLEELREIAEMLYDIRRWRDGLPLDGPPALNPLGVAATPALATLLDDRRSVLLWSGGKDSTLALVTLRANGYVPHALHATINAGAEVPERLAVDRLAWLLGLSEVEELTVEHPDFLDFSRSFASAWDEFPLSNRVPFGRDLILAALAVPVALRIGAAHVSMGHDYDCRNAEVNYGGRRIPRNDLESTRAAMAFEGIVRRHVHPRLGLLPPVAKFPELRILRDMLVDYPDLMAETSFCFWGRNCGRCGKCLRYFLAARLYRPGLLSFESNPLASGACPELQEMLDDPTILFQKEVMVLLGRLAQRGDVRPGENELARFRDTRLAEIEPHLNDWEAETTYDRPPLCPALRRRLVLSMAVPRARERPQSPRRDYVVLVVTGSRPHGQAHT